MQLMQARVVHSNALAISCDQLRDYDQSQINSIIYTVLNYVVSKFTAPDFTAHQLSMFLRELVKDLHLLSYEW